jgi:hypothetical protein
VQKRGLEECGANYQHQEYQSDPANHSQLPSCGSPDFCSVRPLWGSWYEEQVVQDTLLASARHFRQEHIDLF